LIQQAYTTNPAFYSLPYDKKREALIALLVVQDKVEDVIIPPTNLPNGS
jgi:ribosomal protein L2